MTYMFYVMLHYIALYGWFLLRILDHLARVNQPEKLIRFIIASWTIDGSYCFF